MLVHLGSPSARTAIVVSTHVSAMRLSNFEMLPQPASKKMISSMVIIDKHTKMHLQRMLTKKISAAAPSGDA
jgi:hypothetical protein